MRGIRRLVALLAGAALTAVTALVVVALASRGGDDEVNLVEGTASASPTGGLGVMPWAVISPAPADTAGSIPWGSPTATAAATASVPTLTPDERAEAEALLKAAALRLKDLPQGFTLEFEIFTTNEELMELKGWLAEGLGPIGGATLEDLDRWGRILGYNASYGLEEAEEPSDPASFSGTAGYQATVDLFRDSRGASEYFAWGGQEWSNPDDSPVWRAMQESFEGVGLEFRDVTVSSVSSPAVGEERIAAEVAATVRAPKLGLEVWFAAQAVALRRGRAVATLTVLAVNSSPDVDELEALARTLDERMKDALEEAPAP